MVRRLRRKRLVRPASEGRVLVRSNQEWAVDFACDGLATGRSIRILAIVDAFTRECLTLEVDTSLSSQRVTRALQQAIELRGMPESIRCDNGPELTSRHSGLVRGAQNPADSHSAGTTDAERTHRKLQWTAAR
jgi:putative transposase